MQFVNNENLKTSLKKNYQSLFFSNLTEHQKFIYKNRKNSSCKKRKINWGFEDENWWIICFFIEFINDWLTKNNIKKVV